MSVPLYATAAHENQAGGREPKEGFPQEQEFTQASERGWAKLREEALGKKDGTDRGALARGMQGPGPQGEKREDSGG